MREMGDWREYLMERLTDPENAMNYLDVSLEEYQVDALNAYTRPRIEQVCREAGCSPPRVDSPKVIMEEL